MIGKRLLLLEPSGTWEDKVDRIPGVCRGGCRGDAPRTGLSASKRPEIDRNEAGRRRMRDHRRRRTAFALLSILMVATSGIALAASYGGLEKNASRISTVTVIPGFPLVHQHSDNTIGLPCLMCQAWMPWHFTVPVLWDDVKYGGAPAGPPGDNLYGAVGLFDDCPHCSVYSGPACVQMFIMYRGGTAPPQDMIYDICELDVMAGEIAGNGFIERHGVGVTDGTGGTWQEIQTAFQMLASPFYQHNQSDASALTASQLLSYVAGLYPVLWDDHGGWPANMDPTFPTADPKNQGHYKVIAGYDDANTAGVFSDDWALIYDPWPEYTDKSVLPAGAIPGPSGSFDPYWIPVSMVLGDPNDLFLVELAAIPEFSGLLVPVVGLCLSALVAVRARTRRNGI
jgi:hypothetical protein